MATPATMAVPSFGSRARNIGLLRYTSYKAAYHDQSAGLGASYFDYPTATNSAPGRDTTEATNPGNNVNYSSLMSDSGAIGAPYYRTEAGEFELSDSPYGTFDQAGNVAEWNETFRFPEGLTDEPRLLMGGYFGLSATFFRASGHLSNYAPPHNERYDWGFRVATIVPEPSALMFAALGLLLALMNSRPYGLVTMRSRSVICVETASASSMNW